VRIEHCFFSSLHTIYTSWLTTKHNENGTVFSLSSSLTKSLFLKRKMKFSALAILAATAGSAAAEIYLKESFDDVSWC
jgi:hypothetical protein